MYATNGGATMQSLDNGRYDVLGHSNQDATVLSPTAATLCSSPCATTVDFDVEIELNYNSESQT